MKYQHIANDMIAAICKYGVFRSIKAILGFEGMEFGACRKPFRLMNAEDSALLREAYIAYQKQIYEA